MENHYKYHENMTTPALSKSFECDTPRPQIRYCYQSRQFIPETFDAITQRTEQRLSNNDARTQNRVTRIRPMLQKMKRVEEDHPGGSYPWLGKKNSSKVSSIQFKDYKTITIPVHVQFETKCSKHGMDPAPPVPSSSHKDDLLIEFDDMVNDIDAQDSSNGCDAMSPDGDDLLIPELDDENQITRNFDISVTNEDGEDTMYEVTKTYNNQSQDTEEEILLEDEGNSNEAMMIIDREPGENAEKENKIEEESLDLNVIESTNRLDVHSLKDKMALARKSSMARRHRPSRSSMRRVADTADHFLDSTEPRPVIRKRRESSSDSDDIDAAPPRKAQVIPRAAPRPTLLVGLGDLQKSKLFKTNEKQTESSVPPELPSSPPPTSDNSIDITAEISGTNSIQNGHVETGSPIDNLVDQNKSPNRITPTDNEIKNYSFTKPVLRDSDMPLLKIEKRKENEITETSPKPLVSALKPRPAPKNKKVVTTPEQPAKPIWLTDPKLRKSMTALDRKPKDAKTELSAPEWMKTSSEKRQQVRDKLQNSGLQRQSSRENDGATAPWLTEFKSRKTQANTNLLDMLDRNASVLDRNASVLDRNASVLDQEAKENEKNSALTARLTENESKVHANALQPKKPVVIDGSLKSAKENSSTTIIESHESKPKTEKTVTSTNKSESEKAVTSTNEEINNKSVSSPRSSANDTYVPSWSRSSSLKKQPSITGTPSVLVNKESFEEPQWKKDLAERKKARKMSESENPSPISSPPVDPPSQSSVPAWKREVLLRKQSRLSMRFKDESEQKPEVAEWQKKAEERRARFSVHNC